MAHPPDDGRAVTRVALLTGAAIGPEGGIGHLASQVGAFYNEKFKIPVEHRGRLVFASVSSAYNGLLENPLFTGVLGTEIQEQKRGKATLAANLLGGAVGYCVFLILGGTGLQDFLDLPPVTSFEAVDVLYALVLPVIGVLLAVILALLFRVMAAAFGRFDDRIITRALVAGAIFSVVGWLAPIIMFSSEDQIHDVIADPAKYGALLLLVMAVGKLALMGAAFKAGWLGGPRSRRSLRWSARRWR